MVMEGREEVRMEGIEDIKIIIRLLYQLNEEKGDSL